MPRTVMESSVKLLFISAIVLTGLLCGASLDQSIKQLPSRHRIGVTAFSSYAKAADLKNGVPWYSILGIGSALTSIAVALVWKKELGITIPIYLAALFAICHSVCTMLAAPIYFKQKNIHDEKSLQALFNKFELISAIRSAFVALNFLCFIWAVATIL
jgi:hypothetical protein